MKRKLLFLVTLAVVAMLAFAACSRDPDPVPPDNTGTVDPGGDETTDIVTPPVSVGEGQTVINLYAFTDELPRMIAEYVDRNPSFAERFVINPTIVATDGGAYQLALDMALAAGQVDLFAAEAAFVVRYTQGDMADFAMPYSEVGIENLAGKIASAEIAQYTVDLGTRNGEVVGLAFQHTGSALIYRRSIAQQVWGNDDPDFIRTKVGPGWNQFLAAAAELDAQDISIVSGTGDVWQAVRNTGGPWIVNGRLDIHADRMAMFDIARELHQNGWTNDAGAWDGAWFAAMSDSTPEVEEGEEPRRHRQVFSYLGPAWLINYVMAGNSGDTYGDWAIAVPPVGFNWGGTWIIPAKDMNPEAAEGIREILEWITLDASDSGLQAQWAAGTLFPSDSPTKDAVASGVVMANADGAIPFLGGQDMFDIFIPAGAYADGTLFTQYDEQINQWFLDDAVMHYARGEMTRDEALDHFRELVYDNLEIN